MTSTPKPRPKLEFWYDLASTYAYLSAMRIEGLADSAGVEVIWRPFLLGPIFQAQGWASSPFNVYPAKGRYMVRDMRRITQSRGLPFQLPELFPARSVAAARIAVAGLTEGWTLEFSKAVFTIEFSTSKNISDSAVLGDILTDLGLDAATILEVSQEPEIKDKFRDLTDQAQARGIFGAPTFAAEDNDLFWGDDRLEQSITWVQRSALLH
jgi:2-hydroxychromene-2-carboxylate isomerase